MPEARRLCWLLQAAAEPPVKHELLLEKALGNMIIIRPAISKDKHNSGRKYYKKLYWPKLDMVLDSGVIYSSNFEFPPSAVLLSFLGTCFLFA